MRILFFCIFISSSLWNGVALADCYGTISLPLSMRGTQNQLQWSGSIGGQGGGRVNSNCTSPTGYNYDFRYNIVEKKASCFNTLDNKVYYAPVSTSGASIDVGAMDKLAVLSSGDNQFDIWGRLYRSPSSSLPVGTGGFSGFYSTSARLDISSLPAGNYQCRVRNAHGAYGSNTNDVNLGVNKLFNFTVSSNGWATGYVNVKVNSACSIPDSVSLEHGPVTTGMRDVKRQEIKIICNRDNSLKITLHGNQSSVDGVIVNVGNDGSQSHLSLVDDSGRNHASLNIDVLSNVPRSVFFMSNLDAKGNGLQTGNAVAKIVYN